MSEYYREDTDPEALNFKSFNYHKLNEIDKRLSIIEAIFKTSEEEQKALRESLNVVREKDIRNLEERIYEKLELVEEEHNKKLDNMSSEISILKQAIIKLENHPILSWTSSMDTKKFFIVFGALISIITSFNLSDLFISNQNHSDIENLHDKIKDLMEALEE